MVCLLYAFDGRITSVQGLLAGLASPATCGASLGRERPGALER